MSADQEPGAGAFSRRLERWAQESAELRESSEAPGSSVESTVRRYQRSRTVRMALPAPAVSRLRYDALGRRQRGLVMRLTAALLLLPVLVVLALLVGPLVAKVVLLALVIPTAALATHHVRAVRRLDRERHLSLHGGLADAWADWTRSRDELAGMDGASQAHAALAANEVRMETLVLALAEAGPQSGHRETEEHAASRIWVYENAAKAVALAAAERELAAVTRADSEVTALQLAPEGDVDALDHALDIARELTRKADDERG